jgi:hypothetical protein
MVYALSGIVLLLIGGVFFWLNNNSPIQTRIPAVTLPIGAVLAIIGLARVLP